MELGWYMSALTTIKPKAMDHWPTARPRPALKPTLSAPSAVKNAPTAKRAATA